jgi:Transcriptional Coactivator p15 (PC4)
MYNLSNTRVIETRNEQDEIFVVIRDTTSGKFIEIPKNRWAALQLILVDIDNAINQLKEKKDYVKYFAHIGGGWYVSVTTGFWCVDIRRFFYTKNCETKPSKQGLALRLSEWTILQDEVMLLLNSLNPELLFTIPCSMREDHLNDPSVVLGCRECSPFGDIA